MSRFYNLFMKTTEVSDCRELQPKPTSAFASLELHPTTTSATAGLELHPKTTSAFASLELDPTTEREHMLLLSITVFPILWIYRAQ